MRRVALPIALLITISLLLTAVVPAVASPQPDPVCGTCGSSFEQSAEQQGLAVNVTHSTATVQIHANGSATWIATNRVNESAATRLSENPALLEQIARGAATEGWGLPNVYDNGEVTFQSASIDGRTVTIQFRDPDAGERHLGVLVVDYLHSDGVRGGWILNADQFTLVGPSETVVVNDPRATINDQYISSKDLPQVAGGNVTWRGSGTNEYDVAFYDDVYLVFGEAETSSLRVDAAVASATAPIWFDNIQAFVLPALVVYGVLLAGVAVSARWSSDTSLDADRVATVVAGIGLVGIVAAILAEIMHEPSGFGGLVAIYLVTGALALLRPQIFRSARGALTVTSANVLGVGIALLGLGLMDQQFNQVAVTVLRGMIVHLPLAVAPAFGFLVARGDRRSTTFAFIGALASFALAGMVFVPFASRPWGIILIFTVGGALLAALLGVPLAILATRRWSDVSEHDREGSFELTS